jgi:tyrosine-protein phosphatase non-receptor type 9
MTNREKDELLSQTDVIAVDGDDEGNDNGTTTTDQLNNIEVTTTVVVATTNGSSNGSIEDSGTDVTELAAAAAQNGTNPTDIVVAVQEETNGIITELHWSENPPSSASPSSGFSDDDSLTGAHEGDPKTIEQIVDMVRSMGRKGLLKEYAEIRARQPDGTFEYAKLRSNLTKNRYTDVLCYDHSRVVLSCDTDDDPTNDYINANFVDGYKQKNAYISTQGE